MMSMVLAASVLGLAGSLHCLGMCGPLLAGIHAARWKSGGLIKSLLYHLGRISVYGLLGALAGLAGGALIMLGWQQWLAVGAGGLLLAYLLLPKRWLMRIPLYPRLRSLFSAWIRHRSLMADWWLGVLNGFLPCGLVYTALTAAMLTGSTLGGISFMFVFGLGTLPAMMAASELFVWVKKHLRLRSLKPVQYALMLVSFLLVLRGANLGIPYVSPAAEAATGKVDCCSGAHNCH